LTLTNPGTTVKTCLELATVVTTCANAAPAKTFTVYLECTGDASYDCSGVAIDLTGRLSVRLARGCRRVSPPPTLMVTASGGGSNGSGDGNGSAPAAPGKPLFKLSAASARLKMRDVGFSLGGARPAIAADGADRIVLRNVDIRGGAGAQGGALSLVNTQLSMSYGSLVANNASAEGGAIFFKADSGYRGKNPGLRLFRVKVQDNKVRAGQAAKVVSVVKGDKGGYRACLNSHRKDSQPVLVPPANRLTRGAGCTWTHPQQRWR
jgi:hypothetical protein